MEVSGRHYNYIPQVFLPSLILILSILSLIPRLCDGVWLDTEEMGSPYPPTPSTTFWSPIKLCPLGSVVVAGRSFEQLHQVGSVTGLSLQCAKWDSHQEIFVNTEVITSGKLDRSILSTVSGAHDYAIGFSFEIWTRQTRVTFWEFIFSRQKEEDLVGGLNTKVKCPLDWAICGFQTKLVHEVGSGVGSIRRIRFKCCYFCEPEEIELLIRDVTNFGLTEITTQIKKIVGTHLEQGSHSSSQKGQSVEQGREKVFSKNTQISSSHISSENVGTNWHKNLDESLGVNKAATKSRIVGTNVGQSSSFNQEFALTKNFQIQDGTTFVHDMDTVSISSESIADTATFGIGGYKMKSSDTSVGKTIFAGTTYNRATNIGVSPGGTYESYTLGVNIVGTSTREFDFNKQATGHRNGHLEKQGNYQKGIQRLITDDVEEDRHEGFQDTKQNSFTRGGDQTNGQALSQQMDSGNFRNMENILQHNIQSDQHFGRDWGVNHALDRVIQRGDQQVIQALFSAKFGSTSTSNVNWDNTESSQWNEGAEQTDTFVCAAQHRCVVKQIIGKCGRIEFYTPKLIKSSIPLNTASNKMVVFINGRRQDLTQMSGKVMNPHHKLIVHNRPMGQNPGEIWIGVLVPYNRTRVPSDIWEAAKVCPLGSIVVADRVKFDHNMGFTGWSFQCARGMEFDGHHFKFVDTAEISSFVGREGEWLEEHRPNSSAIGFSFVQYKLRGRLVSEGHRLEYQVEKNNPVHTPPGAMNVEHVQIHCPDGYAVCGIQTMMDKTMEAIMALGLKCCFECQPLEKMVTMHSFKNSGNSVTTHSVKIITGPSSSPPPPQNNDNNNGKGNNGDSLDGQIVSEDTRHIRARFMSLSGMSEDYEDDEDLVFNWNDASMSIWDRAEETNLNFQCEKGTRCVFMQLVGICGDRRFRTPFTTIENFPLPRTRNLTRVGCHSEVDTITSQNQTGSQN